MNTIPPPVLGLCPWCEGEARIRKNGALFQHRDPDRATCLGSGRRPVAALTLTFRRWLDKAQDQFFPSDVTPGATHKPFYLLGWRAGLVGAHWTTADELHAAIHRQFPHVGIDYLCREIQRAEDVYAELVGGAA